MPICASFSTRCAITLSISSSSARTRRPGARPGARGASMPGDVGDTREAEFPISIPDNVTVVATDMPEEAVAAAPQVPIFW